MATFDSTPINTNGAFELTEKQSLLKAFRATYADITAGGAFTPTAGPAHLTDSSTGTPGATLAAITSTTPADLTAVGVQLGIIKNAVASLNAQINALETALTTSGILT